MKNFFFLVLICLVLLVSCNPFPFTKTSISVMTFNTQTLFDISFSGNEYIPYNSSTGWNIEGYYKKLSVIARTIEESTFGGADIVALQEVESEDIVVDLINLFLPGLGYTYYAFDRFDENVFGTAIISRFPITYHLNHALTLKSANEIKGTRPIQEVGISIDGRVLVIFNNHWKSKSEGAQETEIYRLEQAKLLKQLLLEKGSEIPVLALGDFNENVNEAEKVEELYSTAFALSSEIAEFNFLQNSNEISFQSVWTFFGEDEGSYYYNEEWETIDNIIFNPAFLSSRQFSLEDFYTVKTNFNTTEEELPLIWDVRTLSGCSDHLPLIVKIKLQ